jgi:hypothetical protein
MALTPSRSAAMKRRCILDEEVTTDQTRWHNRYWIDSDGMIRQSEQYLGAGFFR